jgi:hypothetical protein
MPSEPRYSSLASSKAKLAAAALLAGVGVVRVFSAETIGLTVAFCRQVESREQKKALQKQCFGVFWGLNPDETV